jgi:hypothetical protein
MIAVITGDIISSRSGEVSQWLSSLKDVLQQYGSSPLQWEIYRGDSFQLALLPEEALLAAIHIKAAIKQTNLQDVRMAIGLGEVSHKAEKITESNGTAYVRSGECFESLKKQTIALKSGNAEHDKTLNLMLSLALLTANSWSKTVSEVITTAIEHPDKNQKEIAEVLHKSQSSISEALSRGGYDEIMNLNRYYKKQIAKL